MRITRGRPKKDYKLENSFNIAQNKYNSFFNNDKRNQSSNYENKNNDIINLEQINKNLIDIFSQYKLDLFQSIDNIENYSFYKLLINNWNKEKN